MSIYIEIHWSSGSLDEARRISRELVQQRLVACAQITPWIESIYMWNNQLETAQESKISLKTKQEYFEQIKKFIETNSSYEVPEINYVLIDEINPLYKNWLDESVLPL